MLACSIPVIVDPGSGRIFQSPQAAARSLPGSRGSDLLVEVIAIANELSGPARRGIGLAVWGDQLDSGSLARPLGLSPASPVGVNLLSNSHTDASIAGLPDPSMA